MMLRTKGVSTDVSVHYWSSDSLFVFICTISRTTLQISSSWPCMAERTSSNSAEASHVAIFLYFGAIVVSSSVTSAMIRCLNSSMISLISVISCLL